MIAGKEDLLQAIIEAFLMEKGTMQFYAGAAEIAGNPEAKTTFHDLSQWEKRHMNYLQFLYQSIVDERDVKNFEEFKSKAEATDTEAGIPVKDLEARIEQHAFSTERDALILAMEIEGKAYNLYRNLAKHASDRNARVIFDEMMQQEVKHIDYLKKLRRKILDA